MNLSNIDEAKALKSNVSYIFGTPQGKEVMRFLEEACGWYSSIWDPQSRDLALINDGKRQVIATIKSIMRLSPEQIVNMIKDKEEDEWTP